MIKKVAFICFVVLSIFSVCKVSAQPAFLLHKKFNERYTLIDSLNKAEIRFADSMIAFAKLEKWIKWANEEQDNELASDFELLKLKYYTGGKQVNYALFEREAPRIIQSFNKRNLLFERADAMHTMAHYYFHTAQNFIRAFDAYHDLYEILSKITTDEFPLKRYYVYEYGLAFYFFDDHQNARKYLFEAAEEKGNNMLWLGFQSYNTLGLSYRSTKDYDSSVLFFEKARQVGVLKNDSAEIAVALGNIGHTFFLQGKYDQAIPLLELDAAYSSRYKEWGNAAAALLALAQISYSRHQVEVAHQQCKVVLQWLGKAYLKEEHFHYTNVYSLLAKIYAAKKDMALAYVYADSAAMAKDSLNRKMSARILFTAQRNIEAGEHAAALQHMENERKNQVLLRNSIIAVLFLLMIISLLVYNRKQFTYKQEQLLMRTQKRLVEEELATASARLNSFTQSVIEKSELIEKLQQELNVQSEDVLVKIQQHTILTDADWDHFRSLFEKAHPGYLHSLNEKFPGLSPAEIRFITLGKLNISSKQMAATLGIGSDAIRMMRYRLRKKLGLNEEESLEELIMHI